MFSTNLYKKSILVSAIWLTLIGANLTACGTKGPLYIPEQRYPQQVQPIDATPAAQNVTPDQPVIKE